MDEQPERRPVDIRLLVALAAGGALIGILSSAGALAGVAELVSWMVLGTAAMIAALRRIPDDAFRHVAFGLMLAGFLAGDAKILLWDMFLANHPDYVDLAAQNGLDSVPKTRIVMNDLITGALFGVLFGFGARYLNRRAPMTDE